MTDRFGMPDAGDATSQWEVDVELAWEDAETRAQEELGSLLNRPPGSLRIPRKEEHMEWRDNRLDPQFWQARFEQLAGTLGPERAMHELLRFDQQMQKHEVRNGATE